MKAAIQNEYSQKLETHKSQLKAQNETDLEHFKAKLQIAASERSIRLTRVFEKTVDIVAGTYERLLAFHDAVGQYTSIVEWSNTPPKEDRRRLVAEKYQDFLSYYRPRKPFLPKRTVKKIDDFRQKLNETAMDFMWGVEQGGDQRAIKRGQDRDSWMKAHDFMTKEAPPVLELLEDDLRRILGTYEDN
ncbi:MAG: hypothetical protein K2X06_12760 [Burkholderiales bacterium]|nr:hypothetical protein [Burkholderiales bacterium]